MSIRRKKKTDAGTRPESQDRVRSAADEKALALGMRYDAERAHFATNWIESFCRLYEGDKAGEPLILKPAWRDFFEALYGWVRFSDEWEGWIRRYTHASFWGAKKNGKSPCAAAHNLYLLCGDGEPGQKVYIAAANGEQAKIVQQHSMMMVRQSPELSADCKVNNTTGTITYTPTNSHLMILTGDDSRGARAKEGINGSVTYDEMHVVNREVEERTSRAGISRREPINCSFSTTGDDPDTVGYQRFQYGEQVNKGDRTDPNFLHVYYGAPQNATDADIEKNLVKYGKAANPCWGSLVKPTEFIADWERSKGDPRKVAKFKQYRLDLWVGSTTPWLDAMKWGASAEPFTLDDLRGRECFAAIDLSRTQDMTAFVMVFPWPERDKEAVRVWPMFWLPEQTAKERNHLYPFESWSAAGYLTLTRGGVVDYAVVKADIRSVVRGYDLRLLNLYYDPYYGNEITQALVEGDPLDTGLGCERTEFGQTLMNFTAPAKELERRIKAGLVRHANNPVMNWQIAHCEVLTDRNQNIRPCKPEPHSGKCVDGVVCLNMDFAGLIVPQDDSTISSQFLVL